MLVAGDELRPKIALHSENVVAALGRDAFKGFVGIAFLNRKIMSDSGRLAHRVGTLAVVEVDMVPSPTVARSKIATFTPIANHTF